MQEIKFINISKLFFQEICGIFDSNAYESSGPSRVSCRGES